jgi:hypothetical protein
MGDTADELVATMAGPGGGPFIPGGWGPPPGFRTGPEGGGQPPAPFDPGGPGRMRGTGGIGRFMKSALIGGVVGGLLSAIPLVNALNCCFCMLNVGGIALGLQLYLKAHPDEGIHQGESALFGGIAGAVAGLVASVAGFLVSLFIRSVTVSLYSSLPPDLAKNLARTGAESLVAVPGYVAAYGAAGAIGGVICMHLFFKDRIAP